MDVISFPLTGYTVLAGSTGALRCGLDFFGPEHVVFASDCPFDPNDGPMFIREGIRSARESGLSGADLCNVCCGNAFSLMRLVDLAPDVDRASSPGD